MAFTGTPVVSRIAGFLARISGVTLASGASGTISLNQGSGEVKLPDSLNWVVYAGPDAVDGVVDLEESVQVAISEESIVGGVTAAISVVKADGDDPEQFLITLTNEGNTPSGDLEIYVRYH